MNLTEYRYPCPHCEGELIIVVNITAQGEHFIERVEHSQTIKLQVKV